MAAKATAPIARTALSRLGSSLHDCAELGLATDDAIRIDKGDYRNAPTHGLQKHIRKAFSFRSTDQYGTAIKVLLDLLRTDGTQNCQVRHRLRGSHQPLRTGHFIIENAARSCELKLRHSARQLDKHQWSLDLPQPADPQDQSDQTPATGPAVRQENLGSAPHRARNWPSAGRRCTSVWTMTHQHAAAQMAKQPAIACKRQLHLSGEVEIQVAGRIDIAQRRPAPQQRKQARHESGGTGVIDIRIGT
jgi:hypothetical protein